MRVLIATRAPHRFRVWRPFLEGEGCQVVVALPEHQEIRPLLMAMTPGVLLLDLSEEVCRIGELRRWLGRQCPEMGVGLLAVASRQSLHAVSGEDVDDIVDLAAAPEEVLCRVQRVLRLVSGVAARAAWQAAQGARTHDIGAAIELGELTLDPASGLALLAGRPASLRQREFELLRFLVLHPNRVFRREDLIRQVWGTGYAGSPRTVDTHIRRLRHQLGAFGREYLQTVRGVGYRLAAPT